MCQRGTSCQGHGCFVKRATERRGKDLKRAAKIHQESGLLTPIVYTSSTPEVTFCGEEGSRRPAALERAALALRAECGWRVSSPFQQVGREVWKGLGQHTRGPAPPPFGEADGLWVLPEHGRLRYCPLRAGDPPLTLAVKAAASQLRRRRCPFKARPARGSGARPERWRHGAGGGALVPAPALPAPRDRAAAAAHVCVGRRRRSPSGPGRRVSVPVRSAALGGRRERAGRAAAGGQGGLNTAGSRCRESGVKASERGSAAAGVALSCVGLAAV